MSLSRFSLFILLFIPSTILSATNDSFRNDSSLLILKKAYSSISKNYPEKKTTYNIYYKEKEMTKDSLYTAEYEAILHIYRKTYLGKEKEEIEMGQILLYTRTDSIYQYPAYTETTYQTSCTPRNIDFVYNKAHFIMPSKFKSYIHQYNGIQYYDSIPCYSIRFSSIPGDKKSIKGTLYIDTLSYAYIGATLWIPRPNSIYTELGHFTTDAKYGGINAQVSYKKRFNKWHLYAITYQIDNQHTTYNKETINKQVQYQTLFIDTLARPILYKKQKKEEEIGIKPYYKSNSFKQRKKAQYSFHVGMHPLQLVNPSSSFSYNDTDNKLQVQASSNAPSVLYTIGTDITSPLSKGFSLIGSSYYSISNKNWDINTSILLSYRLPLSKYGGHWFTDLAIGYFFQTTSLLLEKTDNPAPDLLKIDDKRFDSNHIYVYAKKRQRGAISKLVLNYKLSKTEYFISASYLFPLKNYEYIRFKEASGSLFKRKSADIHIHNERIIPSVGDIPSIENDAVFLNAGIRFYF